MRILLCILTACSTVPAQKYVAWVGELGTDHVTIAWGTTAGDNTLGRSSKPVGPVTIKVGKGTTTVADRNWTIVRDLQPDTEYDYEVQLNNRKIGGSTIRTWALKTDKLRFFVIGDWGSGDEAQARIGKAMAREMERSGNDNPARFVITTGDNIYGAVGFSLRYRNTGERDSEWGAKFFTPYASVLARIPFYPSLGNHDGNETESRADLATYLDNFFFPSPQPARYYRFSYGGLADFFCLDSTTNSESGPTRPAFAENGDQHKWLGQNIVGSEVPWKIPFFHHPPFNAGPRHPAARNELAHWLKLFEKNGVKVVFSGHEHNFQYSFANNATGGVRYVVTGSGGELRTGDVRDSMEKAQIEGWAAVLQFLSVEIEGKEMRITPISDAPFNVVDRRGQKLEMPLKVTVR